MLVVCLCLGGQQLRRHVKERKNSKVRPLWGIRGHTRESPFQNLQAFRPDWVGEDVKLPSFGQDMGLFSSTMHSLRNRQQMLYTPELYESSEISIGAVES